MLRCLRMRRRGTMQHRGFRSSITTQGRRMAGARALWRATGMKTEDFQKPIIAIANSKIITTCTFSR